MILKMNKITILLVFLTYVSMALTENFCGNWESFKDEKCIKIVNEEKMVTYEEAIQLCSQSENGSTLITIHSKEEQEFVAKYVFETRKIVANVWLGFKNSNNKFEWIDKTSVEFTNWANGSPGNNSDKICVEMITESSPIGKWVDTQCNKKLLAVCERPPIASISYLQKMLMENKRFSTETRNELIKTQNELIKAQNELIKTQNEFIETRKQLNNTNNKLIETEKQAIETSSKFTSFLRQTFNKNWFHFNSFIDSDGKHRAFIFPLNENMNKVHWDEANEICLKYNATLVEINSQQKQTIFELFLGQLGYDAEYKFSWFWLNAHRNSSGKWKWLRSGNDITFNKWYSSDYPSGNSGFDYLCVYSYPSHIGKWFNNPITSTFYTICELEINLQI